MNALQTHIKNYNEFLGSQEHRFRIWMEKPLIENGDASEYEFRSKIDDNSKYGVLVKARCRKEPDFAAIKILEKKALVNAKQILNIKNEIKILSCLKFKFLIELKCFFQDNVNIYLVMPYYTGGSIDEQLLKIIRFDEDVARFYAAQIVLALEYLHHMGVAHRHVVPESVLLDPYGYLVLSGFDFCKKIDKKYTYTLCGTPEYLSPEMILHTGYTCAVDWWNFGILLYEMVYGKPPFRDEVPMNLFSKICEGKIEYPTSFTNDLIDLISKLLVTEKNLRLGTLKHGSTDIKCHNWFKYLNWDDILYKRIVSKHLPHLIDNTDTESTYPIRTSGCNECENEFSNFN